MVVSYIWTDAMTALVAPGRGFGLIKEFVMDKEYLVGLQARLEAAGANHTNVAVTCAEAKQVIGALIAEPKP